MDEKIKLTLVCHFSNATMRSHLPLGNRGLYKNVRRFLGMPYKGGGYGDVAAWDTYLIDVLSKREDVDLYVVSAHSGLKKNVVSFKYNNVNYSFVKCEYATGLKRIVKSPALWLKLNPMRPIVRKLIKRNRPDIIALIGAENAHISSTVLGIDDIPVLIHCQTIYNNPDRIKHEVIDEKNAFVERELFKVAKYVAVSDQMYYNLFKKMESKALVFEWEAINPIPQVDNSIQKEYDFVTFAVNMCEKKGYYDAIKAFALVIKKYPFVKLNLVGGGQQTVKQELRELINSLGIEKDVVFTSFFSKQEDLFRHIQKSRFALLPSKLDYISGTMVQAIHLGLPLVCYATEGTPLFNQEKECVLIAEMNNVEQLADKMMELLDNPDRTEMLKQFARERLEKIENRKARIDKLVDTYKAIVNYERNEVSIPEYLFYNPNKNENQR